MTKPAHKRHDINDNTWNLLSPRLTGQRGMHGGIAKDNRLFLNAVFWILRTGAPWRDLPPDYGDWKNRKEQREYDRHLYKISYLVENALLPLKRWRGIATRYAKNTSSFIAAVQIRCMMLWAEIL